MSSFSFHNLFRQIRELFIIKIPISYLTRIVHELLEHFCFLFVQDSRILSHPKNQLYLFFVCSQNFWKARLSRYFSVYYRRTIRVSSSCFCEILQISMVIPVSPRYIMIRKYHFFAQKAKIKKVFRSAHFFL